MRNSANPYPQNSDTFQSLRAEAAARELLRGAGWDAFQSVYFIDVQEGIERELDVAARRSWSRERDGRKIDLWLLVECKSLGGKNALFAEQEFGPAATLYHRWLGVDDDAIRARVRRTIDEAGFEIDEARRLIKRFETLAYPAGASAIRTLLPPLPRMRYAASAMRAAGNEKGNDPFFDAWRALLDGAAGAIKEELDAAFGELASDLTLRDAKKAPVTLRAALSSLSMYHPILVIDAPMYLLRANGALIEIDRCRMQHIRISGVRKWFDVVRTAALPDYVAELTDGYTSFFARRRCEAR